MVKKLFFIFLIAGGLLMAAPVFALGSLVKTASDPAVYYLDENNVRHLFPTAAVYQSWYNDFSDIATLSQEKIVSYALGKNIAARPGVRLVTFNTDPTIYAVEPGGILKKFSQPEVIAEIYGADWSRRVVKLPDGFFDDYQISDEKIADSYNAPIGLVFVSNGQYYFKHNDLLWPFKDWNSVLANNFKKTDVVSSPLPQLEKRTKQISGQNQNVFNPTIAPLLNTADCQNKKFKVAFLLVTRDGYQTEQIDKLEQIKKRFAENFAWGSDGLATVDVSFPTTILSQDPDILFTDEDGQVKPDNEAINVFYDNHQDVFDFIALYNNFAAEESVIARYINVTNDFGGTGNGLMHIASVFGSRGKLKGIINMGNIDKYNIDDSYQFDLSAGYVTHELLHHFSGRAKFVDENGQVSRAFLEKPNYDHFNPYVNFISPLGGFGWADQGNGVFASQLAEIDDASKKKFSDLDLYFMGLLPKKAVAPIQYLATSEAGIFDRPIKGELKSVTINQIEQAMGEWGCRL